MEIAGIGMATLHSLANISKKWKQEMRKANVEQDGLLDD
jgi:hypothetical protein